MFKLICLSPLFRLATQGAISTKYIIKNGAYLIEAPPKRPANSYALFLKDELKGKKKTQSFALAQTELTKKWNSDPSIQEKYAKLAQTPSAGYPQIKE